jgi:hypothetical protein
MPDWKGRGGGRPGTQPKLQNSTSATSDPGANPSGWQGRGGGRHRPQPALEPAAGSNGTWIGRGGGRNPIQPVITPANLIQAQKMLLNGAMGALQGVANAAGLGLPMTARELEDPVGSYVFALEIQGVELAHFQECSGLKSSTEVFEIREGGVNHAVHKLPGQSRWENLILRTGISSDSSLLALREMIINHEYSSSSMNMMQGFKPGGMMAQGMASLGSLLSGVGPSQAQPKRFNGSIVIKNNRMQEMVRYTFKDAWAVSWEGPKLDSGNSNLAIETLEIAHHGIEVSRSWRMPLGWT